MPQTIARLYSSQETAAAVTKDLQDHGFSPESMCTIAQPPEGSTESVVDSITKVGIPASAARVYAEHIQRGEVLVGVQPAFGYARSATDILESHHPVAVELPQAAAPTARVSTAATPAAGGWADQAAPLSAALGWRVLLSDPTPFSNWLGRPVLKREPSTSNTLESIRRQSADPAPLSSKLGMKTLSDNPAPLSSAAGWRVLSEKASPLSDKAGWRVTSDDPAPLSKKLGWRTLLNNPTPLSSWLGLPVLSKR